jgi:hypothetical protein
MPRGDAIEYDPYWNTQYNDKVRESEEMLSKMEKILTLIEINEKADVRHKYDFDIFRTTANLIKHTCLTYIDLSNLEYAIREAHVSRFVDCQASVNSLIRAQNIISSSLARRDSIFTDLVRTYEETRLPRGFSTGNKNYFWQQDRARHFGFRRPDMSFLIYDEQLLDLEGYLVKLKTYTESLKSICLN